MEINWVESLISAQESTAAWTTGQDSGAIQGLSRDTLTLSGEALLMKAYGKGHETAEAESASWLADMKIKQENAESPVRIVQTAVTKTVDYLQERLEELIGSLDDEGRFQGGLAKEMQALAQEMQAAQDQDNGARALRLLREQSGELAEVLAPELEQLLADTRQYFSQSLTTAFDSLQIIDLTGKSIGDDLLGLGENPEVDAATASSLLEKYSFIPESSKLDQHAAGEGVLYNTQNDPGLRDLFESIEQSFSDELDALFGDPAELAQSLDQGFMAQGLESFFEERRDGDPDMAQALGAGLESLLDRLSGDAGVEGLHETMDRNVQEAVENFKPKKGYLTTVTAVADFDDQTMSAAKILDDLREIVAKAEATAKAEAEAAAENQSAATAAEDEPLQAGSVDVLV